MMSKNSIIHFLKDYLIIYIIRPFLLDTDELIYYLHIFYAYLLICYLILYLKLEHHLNIVKYL